MQVTRAQHTASDPLLSVWVAANAGTGKTKVLTDRVLRLLLRGVMPSRILCITYTKAAAAEMENRIHETLRRWVAMDDVALAGALKGLTGETATNRLTTRARRLFAEVLDAPEGVRIQTIHSFCQSLLRRFPLEAGIQPHFEVIDERTAQELLNEAKQRLFIRSRSGQEPALAAAVEQLVGRLTEGSFQELLTQLIGERRHLAPLLAEEGGADALIYRIYTAVGLPYGVEEKTLFNEAFAYLPQQEADLRKVIACLMEGGKTDIACAQAMAVWWEKPQGERSGVWDTYLAAFLTKEGEKRSLARFPSKKLKDAWPELEAVFAHEQERVYRYSRQLNALGNAEYSRYIVTIVDTLLHLYHGLKETRQFLDYDDLIILALRLLRQPGIAPWVLYKLDGGLDHVLIDEAQDTSPEQWELVDLLVGEFFSGQGSREEANPRTLFVVGDEKQSIYSFQGAAPHAFGEKRNHFRRLSGQAEKAFETVELGLSFRSTEAVLTAVDAVFSQPHVRQGLSYVEADVQHDAHRSGQAGRVELWPVVTQDEVEGSGATDSASLLADRIAIKIQQWLDDKEILESQGRSIQAGDVLVLLRRRNAFMHHLVRALKRRNIPVAGVDRISLSENIAVMDLLALTEFLLLPEDDLNLACVLKSPLCGIDEETLFTLAYSRGKASLWQRVRQSASPQVQETQRLLESLLNLADYIRPYELFSHVLEVEQGRNRFARRLGEEVFDPLDEFLSLALSYERSHSPSLQGFLQWMRAGDVEIKRDMEQGNNAVRIMTVHGAKGLQAPIVFLPDTVDTSRSRARLFWTQHNAQPVMLWSPAKTEDGDTIATLREACATAEAEESRRLLYVAMTRAEDRLYVCGWLGRKQKDAPEDCWYSWMKTGLRERMRPCSLPYGGEGLYMESPQTQPVQHKITFSEALAKVPMPEYLIHPPAPEPSPPQPLVPSRGDQEEVTASAGSGAVLSPIAEAVRYRRGNVIHKLLQFLPDSMPEERDTAGRRYLSRFAGDYNAAEQERLLAEVLAVLNHPEMAPVFAEGSLAEVPVTGLVQMPGDETPRIVSGQVDRLLVREDGVWIIDYKTQRQPAASLEEVPAAYLRQMAVYRAALNGMYPHHPIHTALLWTAGPTLMVLP